MVRGDACMLRDVSWSWDVRPCVAACLLLFVASGGGGAKARAGDGAKIPLRLLVRKCRHKVRRGSKPERSCAR